MLDSEAQMVSALPLAATPSLARLIARRNHRFGSRNRYRPLYSAEGEGLPKLTFGLVGH